MGTVILIYAVVLIIGLAITFFGSLFLGAAAQRRSLMKGFSTDCPVFSHEEFSKKENAKNIFWGIVGVLLGNVVVVVSSFYFYVILCITGNDPEPWTLVGIVIVLLILVASHMLAFIKGRNMFASEFYERCMKLTKECPLHNSCTNCKEIS